MPARSASYQGQDRFVIQACNGRRNGFFLDSGASNGLLGSNSEVLESDYGWRGICIEPNDRLFRDLERNRSSLCLNCCLYDREGEVPFLEAAQVYGGIVSEYDPAFLEFAREQAARGRPAGEEHAIVPVLKPARTIRSILKEYDAPCTIDYWSLDTEGSELTILKSFPFDEYEVRILTVEHNYAPSREKIAEFLAGHGLRRVAALGIDDAYVSVRGSDRPAWRSRAWRRGG